jgi:hypothetical protein
VKKLLLIIMIMATWMVVSCTTTTSTGNSGCWGFWEDDGNKRGTIEKKRQTNKPYRQCVNEEAPHIDLERRPWG